MELNILQIMMIWTIPISIELLVVWFFVSTVKMVESKEKNGK